MSSPTPPRGPVALYLTAPQIDLLLAAVDRLEQEMSEPGEGIFNSSQLRALGRAKSELLRAVAGQPKGVKTR